MIDDPNEILTFWREAGPSFWFKKDEAFDARIALKFKDSHEVAGRGGYDDWVDTGEGALALIIMLDQFSRNLYRNAPQAFAQDQRCLAITHDVLKKGLDKEMPEDLRVFCYMPLMHSEDLDDQELCVELMKKNGYTDNIRYAEEHRDIIKRFGRFPHRNAALGRDTTDEERKFLEDGGFSG